MRRNVAAALIAGMGVMTMTMMTLASCAKREAEDINVLEQKSLDAWIEKYVRGRGISVARQTNGMWVEFLADGNQSSTGSKDTVVWAQLHYTSTDIEGNVFATRDSMEAMRQRTFTSHTYYTPEFVYCDDYNSWNMPAGQHFALKNELTKPDNTKVKMTTGARVRLYMPSFLAYGSSTYSNDQGYGGQYPLNGTKIVVQDLSLRGVVKNPLEHEEDLVKKYATERWGVAETDTIAPGFWVDTLNFRPRADLLAKFPQRAWKKEYDITADSTVNIWYVGRFLPSAEYPGGFIFDTNIPEIYEEFYNRRKGQDYTAQSKTFAALSYTPKEDQESYIAAFYRAIPDLRKGQWSRVVFPSSYGYGATGLSKAIQDQQAYYSQMANYYMYSSMYSNYGSSYGGYGSSYGGYGSYYNPYNSYYGYSTSGYSEEEEEQTIVTEIQPYTPLIFEIYIEDEHAED